MSRCGDDGAAGRAQAAAGLLANSGWTDGTWGNHISQIQKWFTFCEEDGRPKLGATEEYFMACISYLHLEGRGAYVSRTIRYLHLKVPRTCTLAFPFSYSYGLCRCTGICKQGRSTGCSDDGPCWSFCGPGAAYGFLRPADRHSWRGGLLCNCRFRLCFPVPRRVRCPSAGYLYHDHCVCSDSCADTPEGQG